MPPPDTNTATRSTLPPLEAARHLVPMIRAQADEIDRTRCLPRPVFEAIYDAGLFRLGMPRAIGGLQADLPTHVRVIEELAKADASTAWVINQNAVFATLAARLPEAVARAIWIDVPRSVASNTPAPTAQAVVVPGGYRVTGKQGFSTGCRHASWIASQAQVIENGQPRSRDGKPEVRYCFVPVAQVELIDTWNVRGMRGTGTHHFAIEDVFVPAERSVLARGATVLDDGALYRGPFTLHFAAGDAAVALATARGFMDEFYTLAGSKAPRASPGLLRDQSIPQHAIGQAEATLRSARAFLMEAVDDMWREATAGPVGTEARARLRLAATHGIRAAAEAIGSLYPLCGASIIFEGSRMHRSFQDIHVMTQHVQARLSHYELVGQFWLGAPWDETQM